MKQKLGLACALIHEPKVLLLDEPTGGVDPVTRQDFWQLIIRVLADGAAVIISTPYMDEAVRCSRLGFLHHGRLLVQGAPRELTAPLAGRVLELAAQPKDRPAPWPRRTRTWRTSSPLATAFTCVCARPPGRWRACPPPWPRPASARAAAAGAPSLEDAFISLLQARRKGVIRGGRTFPPARCRDGCMDKAIEVHDLVKRFGDFTAVDHVASRGARRGGGLPGPKRQRQDDHHAHAAGPAAAHQRQRARAGLRHRRDAERIRPRVGYMSQKFALYEDLTVRENIVFYAGVYGMAPAAYRPRVREVIELIGLAGRDGRARRGAGRRLAAAAGAGHRHRAPPAIVLSRRAHVRGRPRGAARVLGPDLYPGRGRRHGLCQHALHGRGRALRAAGHHEGGRLLALDTPSALNARGAGRRLGHLASR